VGVYQFVFQADPPGDVPRHSAAGSEPQRRLRLKSERWHSILGFLVAQDGSLLARVALSHADGDDTESVRWRPLRTLHYDAELDELELTVAVERGATLRYLVSSPRCVLFEAQLGQRVLRVNDACGLETVIRVREGSRVDCAGGGGKATEAHE
jgi:hypothetical protein